MVISKNLIIKGNLTKFSLIKIVSFLILAWIYNTHEKRNFDNFPGIEEKNVKIEDTVIIRSLAKHGFKEEREQAKLEEKLSYDGDNLKEKKFSDDRSTYGNLKKGELNELELYKKKYNDRYTKKKGLKKLDCYWENKIFDKFEYVNIIAEKKKNNKKRFIKIILNKNSIFLTLFALLPVLGLIIPNLFAYRNPKDRFMKLVFGGCKARKPESPNVCKIGYCHITAYESKVMFYMNAIITYALIIVVILIFFYISVKCMKYKLLKEGIGNITLKEYFRLLKNTF